MWAQLPMGDTFRCDRSTTRMKTEATTNGALVMMTTHVGIIGMDASLAELTDMSTYNTAMMSGSE
jgi:hypothetical protein